MVETLMSVQKNKYALVSGFGLVLKCIHSLVTLTADCLEVCICDPNARRNIAPSPWLPVIISKITSNEKEI